MADITDINVNGTSYNILDDEGMRYVSSPTNGDVLTTDASGQAVDSGVTLASLSGKQDALTTGDGINITNGTISNFFENLAEVDLDTVTHNFQGYVRSVTNSPNGTFGFLIVLQRTNYYDRTAQIFIPLYENAVYTRVMYNSLWSTWSKLYSDGTLTGGNGIDITNGVISNVFQQLAGVDLNTVTYNYQGYVDSACTNKPTSTGGGFAAFFQHGSSVIHGFQLFNRYTTDELYFRRYNNGTWGDWTSVANAYQVGDQITNTNSANNFLIVAGYLRNTTTINFTIPLAKSTGASVTGVSFSTLSLSVRNSESTVIVNNVNVATNSNYTISAKLSASGINIALTIPTTTATTGVPLMVLIGNMTATFS